MLLREIVYIILDEIHNISDDATYTEDHVAFLVNKYRAFLIKSQQDKDKNNNNLSESSQQEICLDLEPVDTYEGDTCSDSPVLKSTQQLPDIVYDTAISAFPINYYLGTKVIFVSKERMRYVGHNKWLKNFIYASIGSDKHLYLTASNNHSQLEMLEKIKVAGVFEDFEKAAELACDADGNQETCDPLDQEFKIEGYMVPNLIELTVKELLGASYRPNDDENNAKDDLADLATFIRRNSKSALAKQIEND